MSSITYHIQPSQQQEGMWGVFEQNGGAWFLEVAARRTREEAEDAAEQFRADEREAAARDAEEWAAEDRCPCCGAFV